MPGKQNIVAAVNKARRDNCKGWQDEERDGNRDGAGFTAKQRVWDAKALHMVDQKRFPISKNLYNDLKAEFKNATSAEKSLVPTTRGEQVGDGLMKAMVAYTTKGNRSLMSQQLILLDKVNETEAMGILQFALETKPSTSSDQSRITKMLLRFMVDHNFATAYPALMAHMVGWLDEVFVHFQSTSKSNNYKPRDFIASQGDLILFATSSKGDGRSLHGSGRW